MKSPNSAVRPLRFGPDNAVEALFGLLAQICLLIGAGAVLKKYHVLGENGSEVLTNLIVGLVLPCNIIFSFHVSVDTQLYLTMAAVFVLSLLSQIFFAVINLFLYRRFSPREQPSAKYATICPNCAFLGNPVAQALYGGTGVLLSAVYQLPQRIAMWSIGVSYFSGKVDRKTVIRQLLTHPCVIAVFLGLLLMLTGLPLPAPLSATIQAVGACCTPLSMLFTGMILAESPLRKLLCLKSLYFSLLRLVALPGVLYLVCLLVSADPLARGIVVIMAAMPGGTVSAILASKYHCDAQFAAKNVVLSTLLSCITIPLWSYLLLL